MYPAPNTKIRCKIHTLFNKVGDVTARQKRNDVKKRKRTKIHFGKMGLKQII